MRTRFASSLVVISAIACIFSSRSARAQEHEHHLGLGGGVSMLDVADKSTMSVGAGLTLHYAYSIDDMFLAMVEGSYSVVAAKQQQDTPDAPHTRPATVSTVSVGVGYILDVIHFVPYFGLLATGAVLGGGTLDSSQTLLGGTIAAGVDYRFTRWFAAGVAYRQFMFLTDSATYPSYSMFLLRAEYILKL